MINDELVISRDYQWSCAFFYFLRLIIWYMYPMYYNYTHVEMEFPCILPIKHGHGYGHEIQIQHWYADMVNPKTVW